MDRRQTLAEARAGIWALPDALEIYRQKRRFDRTPEPAGTTAAETGSLFVVHKHAARRLHYDLRLQFGDALKSWAVTRGPSLDPADRRLAVHVEDHPLDYGSFEGTIPRGEYGAGGVIIWDRGHWAPMEDPEEGYRRGALKFRLDGEKLLGGWTLVRLKRREGERDNWLLIKERDDFARPGDGDALLREAPESVVSGQVVETLTPPKPPPRGRAAGRSKVRLADAVPADAEQANLPDFVAPQLASLAAAAPDGEGWLHEIKFDGYRTLVRIEGDDIRLCTRNGHDWTARYGDLPGTFRPLAGHRLLLDGEIVVQDEHGVSSFAALQDALAEGRPRNLVFYAFDLLHVDGRDLMGLPLSERKAALSAALAGLAEEASPLQLSDHILGRGSAFAAEACRLGLEGIVSKRTDAPYRSGRTRTWLKSKCVAGDEFIIVGYTETPAAGGLAALLLAEGEGEDGNGLRYVGRAGSGISRDQADRLTAALEPLLRAKPVLAVPPVPASETVYWVEPKLAAEVTFATRTAEGFLRHAAFKGLRLDKSADEIRHQAAEAAPVPVPAAPAAQPVQKPRLVSDADLATIWVTNPDRAMFGGSGGATKLDLALYYARVGDWMLPEVAGRPVSLVRCPTGEADACFYQRHAGAGMPASVKRIPLREGSERKRADYVYIEDARGLLDLAQFGVVEFHPWGCRIDRPERPDRMIFDLDPDESLRWRDVVAAAFDVRAVLDAIGLAAFVKTTGGKGLHLVVPLARRQGWTAMRDFSAAVVKALAAHEPQRFTANLALASRKGKIFIDYLRNGRSATAVAAYSLRARPGLPVATPLHWEEVEALDDPAELTFRTVPERLSTLTADPWGGMAGAEVSLGQDKLRRLESICPPK